MKEKEFERQLDKKIQDHAKIMSDEKRKKIHTDYAKNHSQNELADVQICLNTLQLYLDLSESDFNYAIDVKLERYKGRK